VLNRVLRLLVVLPAILFVVLGLRWITQPSAAAGALGMPLLDGPGRSSQIGDVGAAFLSMGLLILIALVTGKRSWFQAPALMLSLVALFRVLAWLFHGAPLAVPMIVVELGVAGLLIFASSRLSGRD
jgi:hypothetical protein